MAGPLWTQMMALERHRADRLVSHDVPKSVGVYVWMREGSPVYSGRAAGASGLHERIWRNHLGVGPDLSRSSFRRNVCAHLDIADTSMTKLRPTRMTAEDVAPVNEWIRQCEDISATLHSLLGLACSSAMNG
jgi:hypothetical protein